MAYDDYTPTQREEADIARDEGLEEWGMDTTAGDIENIPHPPGMNPHRAYAYWAATNPVEAAMRPDLLPSVDAMRLVRAAREGDPEAQRKVDTVNALARSGMRASPVAAKARDNLMRAAALDDIERQTGRPFGGGEDVSGDMYLQGCAGDSEGVGSLWGKLRNIGPSSTRRARNRSFGAQSRPFQSSGPPRCPPSTPPRTRLIPSRHSCRPAVGASSVAAALPLQRPTSLGLPGPARTLLLLWLLPLVPP